MNNRFDAPRFGVIGTLWAWLLLALTHAGARAPYSDGWAIFGGKSARLNGAVVNPDALPVHMVTLFFYDGETPRDWHSAHYMIGTVISFLVVLAVVALDPDD